MPTNVRENIKNVFEHRFDRIVDTIKKATPKQRLLDQATDIANLVLAKEDKYSKLSDQELKKISYQMMEEIEKNKVNVDNFLVDGLAIAREMIYRTYNQRAYKVQLIGAIIVHFGDFAEMATGEGKTLTLLLVSYVNALAKKGVHIVTVNEYLVERDAEYSRKALSKLGISVGFIKSTMDPKAKKEMYNCDITYVSNSELGFDYLRDNMVQNYSDKMQRPLYFAIVDEADSVLIDEARTPLIIAGTPQEDTSMYKEVDAFVKSLKPNDYIIDLEAQAINLNDNGIKKAEQYFKLKNLYDIENSEIVHKIMNSLRANYIMEAGKEYIVRKNPKKGTLEIALVDSFTGRIMDGRMYSAGLHQAIQAKENVPIEPENLTMATITYQSFFRLYKKLAGVSGTALTEKNELLNIYNMVVVNIPFNKPKIRKDQPDYIFATKQLKWKYVVADIKKRHALGQPVLVGTVSVEDSELLHQMLNKIGIPHQVLNAKNNAQEAKIVEKAGQKGAVTIATNMAGRGTDIKLGEGVKELGGLFVLGTERNESRRIDNQLRGRSGRQGDPGESRFFISLQDSLFKRFATDYFDKAQYKLGEDVIDLKFFSKLLDRTQKKVENLNFDVRKNLIDYDYVLSEQRELFYKQRDNVLLSDNVIYIVFRMVPRIIETMISLYRDKSNPNIIDIDTLLKEINKQFNINIEVNLDEIKNKSINEIFNFFTYAIRYVIYQTYKKIGKDVSNDQWKKIIIASMDMNWTKFLDKIQKLRDNVALRSFEQKSPLNIYVEDSDYLFFNMTITISNETIASILKNDGMQTKTFNLDKADSNDEINKITQISNSIDSLELSPKQSTNENNDVDNKDINNNDKINTSEKEKIEMENNNNGKIKDNIDNVVDEIFKDFNTKADKQAVEEISFEKTANGEYKSIEKTSTPPPIPTASNSTAKNNNDDFVNEVLNVVNNDIKPKEIKLDLDGIVADEKPVSTTSTSSSSTTTTPPPIPNSTSSSSTTTIVSTSTTTSSTTSSVATSGRDEKYYSREDQDKIDNYNSPNYKNSVVELYRPVEKNLENYMKQKELELSIEAQKVIDKAKDEKIKELQRQIDNLATSFNEYKIHNEEERKAILSNENLNLKEIHTLLLETVRQQYEMEDDFNDAVDLLTAQQQAIIRDGSQNSNLNNVASAQIVADQIQQAQQQAIIEDKLQINNVNNSNNFQVANNQTQQFNQQKIMQDNIYNNNIVVDNKQFNQSQQANIQDNNSINQKNDVIVDKQTENQQTLNNNIQQQTAMYESQGSLLNQMVQNVVQPQHSINNNVSGNELNNQRQQNTQVLATEQLQQVQQPQQVVINAQASQMQTVHVANNQANINNIPQQNIAQQNITQQNNVKNDDYRQYQAKNLNQLRVVNNRVALKKTIRPTLAEYADNTSIYRPQNTAPSMTSGYFPKDSENYVKTMDDPNVIQLTLPKNQTCSLAEAMKAKKRYW